MATSKHNVINNTWHSGGEWGASEYYIYLRFECSFLLLHVAFVQGLKPALP